MTESVHESLRLYAICKGMKWTHLPQAGGLYDQHPDLLDDFMTIMGIEARVEKAKNETEMRKSRAKNKR